MQNMFVSAFLATGHRHRGVVTFPCRLFDADYLYYYDVSEDDVIVVGYCFRLVSVASDGGIKEHLERCLPLSPSQQGRRFHVLNGQSSDNLFRRFLDYLLKLWFIVSCPRVHLSAGSVVRGFTLITLTLTLTLTLILTLTPSLRP